MNLVPTDSQRRREQNRAAQRAFRMRKDELVEKLKEECSRLARGLEEMKTLCGQQLEVINLLESKIKEFTGERQRSEHEIARMGELIHSGDVRSFPLLEI